MPTFFVGTIIKFSPVLFHRSPWFPILQKYIELKSIYVQSGHWTHSWSATHVLLQECTTAQCHGQQRGRRLAPRICCCCKDFPQEFLPWSMLICCHLIAASLVTVINLTNLQWWNVTKYSNIQVQLWHTLFMSTILPLQCIQLLWTLFLFTCHSKRRHFSIC